ncbi:MAG: hypothetical protein ACE37H_06515 [Phycisphaeraceae bacterium]
MRLTARLFTRALTIGLLLAGSASAGDASADLKKRPGYQMHVEGVHPGWSIEQARPDDFLPQSGALAFSPDGRFLAISSFEARNVWGVIEEPNGTLYVLENPTAKDTAKIKVHTISDQLFHPLGAAWIDDGLFVLERDEVSKWTDTDGDGIPDKKQTFASGWISDNFHHFSFGLAYRDGFLYGALSTTLHMSKEERETLEGPFIGGNAPNPPHRGCVMKVDAKTGEIQWIAGGLRTPNGVGLGPEDILLVPDNQGDWKPANMIYVVEGGEFLGKYNSTSKHVFMPDGGVPSLFHEKEMTWPAVWLPQNEIGNSPSATLTIPDDQPFAGQVLLADITQGAIHRVYMQEVDGVWQGTAFRFTMGLEAGPQRLAWGPDGCLYVAGHGAGQGNWGWNNKKYGLQRLRPTGETAFEFEKIETTQDGFRVSFTKPVPKDQLRNLDNWLIDAWTYVFRPRYGGPKEEPHKVTPTAVRVADDGKSAELVVGDRRENFVYHIRIDATTAEGEAMWSPEAWLTFRKAPK